MLNIACVKSGTKYGPEYVNILFDMVRRNLAEGTPGRFVCFTNDSTGLSPGISVEPLPPGLIGWWNKIALFRPEAFPAGSRVVYFDLDTLIVGPLDDIIKYSGPFAMQRDFYTEARGSSIMAWEAGTLTHIWDNWIKAGMPDMPGGDQVWIGSQADNPDMIEDVFPGCAVSFKRHCLPYPPRGAKVISFHGEPKPHQCEQEWVKNIWKIGGGTSAELEIICNTRDEVLKDNIRSACKRDIPWLGEEKIHDGHAIIVGGAPSVNGKIEELRRWADSGATIFSLNNSAAWLLENGIKPSAQVIVDARVENARFVQPGLKHYIASQCAPETFDSADNATLWHCMSPFLEECISNPGGKPEMLIATGSTVGLAAMGISYVLGYRKIHLYGMDSSYSGPNHHVYSQPINDSETIMDVTCQGRTFRASPWMIAQAEQFQEVASILANWGCDIMVHGSGLLPWIAMHMQAPENQNQMIETTKEEICHFNLI